MNKNAFKLYTVKILTPFFLWILIITPLHAQEIYCGEIFLEFKKAKRAACGQRDEAIRLGKMIIKNFEGDGQNPDVVEYVKKTDFDYRSGRPRMPQHRFIGNSF